MSKYVTEIDDFDFGFTATTTDEINAPIVEHVVNQNTKALSDTEQKYEQVITNLLKSIDPLLDNLAKDSETKAYIHWPDRKAKIAEFKARLHKIAGR